MSSYVKKLYDSNIIHTPKWLPDNIMFEGITGSVAYGVSNDTSDMDIVGFCMPPKELMFPHLSGEIFGFGKQIQRFEQYQEHHIDVKEWNKTFDITIYSIVKFFQLAMENNPNMVDVLFLPRRCVLHSTAVYEKVRDNRHLFLHKGCWPKFKGYSYSQLSKLEFGTNKSNQRRAESIAKLGYDTKFAYHIVRLLLEVEQILTEHTLNLERNSEVLKDIRNGNWSLEKLKDWFSNKEEDVEKVYSTSTLDYKPKEHDIKNLLLECIDIHYGKIPIELNIEAKAKSLIREMQELLEKYK